MILISCYVKNIYYNEKKNTFNEITWFFNLKYFLSLFQII